MDGAKGEEYFNWDFKIKTSNGEVGKKLIDIITTAGYTLIKNFQDEAYFKKG